MIWSLLLCVLVCKTLKKEMDESVRSIVNRHDTNSRIQNFKILKKCMKYNIIEIYIFLFKIYFTIVYLYDVYFIYEYNIFLIKLYFYFLNISV